MDIIKALEENSRLNDFLHSQKEDIETVSKEISNCFKKGNKILIFGNGGSAADSQHIAGELIGKFKKERKGLPAIALTTDTSILTSWSNDKDFLTVFERQVEAIAKQGDILWGISTSGESENIIKAFEKGSEIGTINFSLTGKNGGRIKEKSDLNINIPSQDTPRIQEMHQLIYHIICEIVEEECCE
jgi:D-sedoheptulose 7-phosphate isomerase